MNLSAGFRYCRKLQSIREAYQRCEVTKRISTSRRSDDVNPVKHTSAGVGKERDPNSQPPDPDSKNNWVGPPHEVSNLRMTHFHMPEDELFAMKQFREKVEEIQAWNQVYWEKHNANFAKLKEEFIHNKLREVNVRGEKRQTLTADEMAIFYKKFLNDNHKKHISYNSEWYRKYVTLLWYAGKASIAQSLQNFKKRFQ